MPMSGYMLLVAASCQPLPYRVLKPRLVMMADVNASYAPAVWRKDPATRASWSSRRSLSAGISLSGGANTRFTASAGYEAFEDTEGVAVAMRSVSFGKDCGAA